MPETKNEEKNTKSPSEESKKEEQKTATLDERITKMENEAIRFPGGSSASTQVEKTETAPIVKEEMMPKEKETNSGSKKTEVVEAAAETESLMMSGMKSHKTMVAFAAGVVIGALLTSLFI